MARGRSGESVEGPEGDQVGLNGLAGACTGVVDRSREPAMGIGNDVKPRGTERTKRKPGALEGGGRPTWPAKCEPQPKGPETWGGGSDLHM